MAVWPETLPERLQVEGFSETLGKGSIRTEMEVGPPKIRRRTTAAPSLVSGMQYLTLEQVATLKTFYETTLKYGSLDFEWYHPISRETKSFYFIAEPVISAAGGTLFKAEYSFLIKADALGLITSGSDLIGIVEYVNVSKDA